ncbi:MAG: hypothetical protein Q9182_006211 [Xanthomendoza sp. 2 TL-2023]
MTSFSPEDFPYDLEDKGLDYPSQVLEEPFSDFFDQYLTHTISAEANEFDYPDLFTDGETLTDSTSNASSNSQYHIPHDRSQKSLSKTAFLPQNYHSHPRRERLQPAVSGLELLLDIEGRANRESQGPQPPQSAPATTTTLPLRRKPGFHAPKPLKHPSKSIHQAIGQSKNMMRPSYNYRHECPQAQEWAHDFEQLNLNAGIGHFPTPSALAPSPQSHDGTATAFPTPRQMTLRDEFLRGDRNGNCASSNVQSSIDAIVQAEDELFDPFQEQDGKFDFDSTVAPHQLQQSPSWATSVSENSEATFVLSGNDIHGLPDCSSDTYYTNGLACKSAPVLPYQLNPQFSMESFGATSDSVGAFMNDDLPIDALSPVHKPQPSYPDPPGLPLTSDAEPSRADSPSRRISSPSLPPTPSRLTHRRSKSAAPRRKSASTLRTPKSNGSMSMGFVNFTPQDSKRILTGVAPSGSSKTKARREQEANEKKRKLSAAVLRAVEEAGGNTEGLRREGLLVEG